MERVFSVNLLGAFGLRDPDGNQIRLGKKPQALLAILLLARGKPKSRAYLQGLLWSNRGEVHGRDSLKKAISSIRSALDDRDGSVLLSDRGPVSVDYSRFKVDVDTATKDTTPRSHADEEILEGCEVRDPAFDSWLRDTRALFIEEKREARNRAVNSSAGIRSTPPIKTRPVLSISCRSTTEEHLSQLVDSIRFRITQFIHHEELIDIREPSQSEQCSPCPSDFILDLAPFAYHSQQQLSLKLINTEDHSLVWCETLDLSNKLQIQDQFSSAVTQCVHQITRTCIANTAPAIDESRESSSLVLSGVEAMFRLSNKDLVFASQCLDDALNIHPCATTWAWKAYLTAFRQEQNGTSSCAILREEAQEYSRRALETAPFNPLARSLLAHVQSFVLHDKFQAIELLEPLEKSVIDNPMYLHCQAMRFFYVGNYKRAAQFAEKANQIGSYHPYAYAFSTSLCMIYLMLGNLDHAIAHGEVGLKRGRSNSSIYGPLARYLSTAYSLKSDYESASQIFNALSEEETDNFVLSVLKPNRLMPSEEARSILRKGFENFSSSRKITYN